MLKSARRVLLCAVCAVICIIALAIGLAMPKVTYANADSVAAPNAITEQTGVGLGINVVKATAANDYITGNSVLDLNKIQGMPFSKVNLNINESFNHSTEDISNLILDYQLNFGLDGGVSTFLGSLKSDLENVFNIAYDNYTYKYYNILEHKIVRYKLSLDNYLNADTYTEYFSDDFLDDLQLLSQNNDYYSFFDKYGTHIIGSANYGGRLVATYSLASNKFILNGDVSSLIQNEVQFNSLNNSTIVNIATILNNYFATDYLSSDLQAGFYVKALGGDAFASGIIANFEDGYSDWAASFNGSDNNSVIVDYDNDGLVPLWEILPASYANLATKMKYEFENYYSDFEDNILIEFKSTNTVEFAGGVGSQDDPFLISNEEQLRNIEDISMNANYKLINDIELFTSNWIALGGYYKEKPFNGVLDGNYKKISNLCRTADIVEQNNGFYFGLFGYIGSDGVIKNLTLDNVNIMMDGPEVNDADAKIYVGALAGMFHGTAQNITVKGIVSYDRCTNGYVYTGGLAGAAYEATFKNCTNNADVTSGRYTGVGGGIVGYSTSALFSVCTNTGDVWARCTGWGGQASAGGIAGEIYNGSDGIHFTTFTSCTNSGDLKPENYPGGFISDRHKGDLFAKSTANFYT